MAERPADAPAAGGPARADGTGDPGDEHFGDRFFEIAGDGIVVVFLIPEKPPPPGPKASGAKTPARRRRTARRPRTARGRGP
ncbi:hypothetical protein ACFQHO_10890 [Actinomadura yumaensis]|uniref:hypothetical protein n=1 Tax=Actinomadura yumaensis TaxID=111807 RepID=UPI00360DC214